jgi:hypothetical protein
MLHGLTEALAPTVLMPLLLLNTDANTEAFCCIYSSHWSERPALYA